MTELPDGWTIAPLGEIADTQLGKMLNRSNQVGDATVPYLRNVNVQWGRIDMGDVKEMDIYPDEVAKFMAEPGDLLVCEGGESGRAAIWNGSSAIGIQNALHRIRPKAGISSRYLLYYFEWQVKSRMIDHLLSGVTITHFTQEKLRKMLVQYPPLDEQVRIVEALDDHLSRLDKALAEVRGSEELASQFRRAVLEESIFGEGKSPNATLGDHIETRKSKGIPSQDQAAKYLGLEHVEAHLGRVSGFASARDYKSASPMVEEGDLLYGRLRPYLNKVVIAPEKLYVSGEFIVMKPSASLETTFLKHLLMSPRFLSFTALLDTGDRPRVSWEKIANFEFPLPNNTEQRQIVQRIDEAFTRISSMQDDFAHVVKNVETLKRSVLHAAFSGQL